MGEEGEGEKAENGSARQEAEEVRGQDGTKEMGHICDS